MTDEEYCLYRARQWAADRYRAGGYDKFAKRVENGLEDECSQMRLGRFFFQPAQPPGPAFIVAPNEISFVVTG